MHAQYKHVAERLGFTLTPPNPGLLTPSLHLSGTLNGVHAMIFRVMGSAVIDTVADLMPPFDFPFSIGTVNLATKIRDFFGSERLHTGDEEFDKHFVVHTGDLPRLMALITPRVREGLFTIASAGVHLHVSETQVEIKRHSELPQLDTEEELEGDLRAVVGLARFLRA